MVDILVINLPNANQLLFTLSN